MGVTTDSVIVCLVICIIAQGAHVLEFAENTIKQSTEQEQRMHRALGHSVHVLRNWYIQSSSQQVQFINAWY